LLLFPLLLAEWAVFVYTRMRKFNPDPECREEKEGVSNGSEPL